MLRDISCNSLVRSLLMVSLQLEQYYNNKPNTVMLYSYEKCYMNLRFQESNITMQCNITQIKLLLNIN